MQKTWLIVVLDLAVAAAVVVAAALFVLTVSHVVV